MITASHNPKEYNGLKFCLAGARPVGEESGLGEIRALTEKGEEILGTGRGFGPTSGTSFDPYVDHVLSFTDVERMRPLTVAVDTANGMGGLVVPAVMERLPVTLHHLYAELDGTFPNHPADPIDPANQRELKRVVLEEKADVGMAFDGDADRVFLVDERADDVSGSILTALIAAAMLEREPGAKIVHNVICSWTVPEVIREHGGEPIRTRVGHSFIKQVMADTGAIFGGEHSGHYYFRDNYGADSGLIAAVITWASSRQSERTLSQLLQPYRRYASSGEINTRVDDPQAKIEEIAAALPRRSPGPARRPDGRVRRLVVQRSAFQHRAVAAVERGGEDRGAPRREDRGAPRADTGRGRGGRVVTLDAELLEILVCPNDRGDVDYLEDEQVIVCRTCGYRYPVRDGIPVMLIDEARSPGTVRARDP